MVLLLLGAPEAEVEGVLGGAGEETRVDGSDAICDCADGCVTIGV